MLKVTVPGLGQQIKQKRTAAKLQPARVAADAGMSVSNLYLIESGRALSLPEETLQRLSDVLGFDFVSEVYHRCCDSRFNSSQQA